MWGALRRRFSGCLAWRLDRDNECLRGILRVETHMAAESLAEVVRSLTLQEQEAVRQFIDYLKQRGESGCSQSPFLQAADEFIAEHPELLQRLAR